MDGLIFTEQYSVKGKYTLELFLYVSILQFNFILIMS